MAPSSPPGGRVDERLGYVDPVTDWWLQRQKQAIVLAVGMGLLLALLSAWLLGFGSRMEKLPMVQSFVFFLLAGGMVLHHRLSKGCWMHYRKIPVCHGFYGTGLMGVAVLFVLLSLRVSG